MHRAPIASHQCQLCLYEKRSSQIKQLTYESTAIGNSNISSKSNPETTIKKDTGHQSLHQVVVVSSSSWHDLAVKQNDK